MAAIGQSLDGEPTRHPSGRSYGRTPRRFPPGRSQSRRAGRQAPRGIFSPCFVGAPAATSSVSRFLGAGFCFCSLAGMVWQPPMTRAGRLARLESNNLPTVHRHVRVSPEWFQHRDTPERVDANIENQAVPVCCHNSSGPTSQAFPAEIGSGCLWWLRDGIDHVFLLDETFDRACLHEPLVKGPVRPDIVVLQIHQRQLWVIPFHAVTGCVCVEEVVFRHPVQATVETQRVGLQPRENVLPVSQDG